MTGKYLRNFARMRIAGTAAVEAARAGQALFRSGGHRILGDGVRTTVQVASEKAARAFIAANTPAFAHKFVFDSIQSMTQSVAAPAANLLSSAGLHTPTSASAAAGTAAASRGVATVGKAAKLARTTGRVATATIARSAARAGGWGALTDGAFAGLEAAWAYKKGRVSKQDALIYTGKEALSGGLATSAGVAIAVTTVALTGITAAPVVFTLAAAGALASKSVLRRVMHIPSRL